MGSCGIWYGIGAVSNRSTGDGTQVGRAVGAQAILSNQIGVVQCIGIGSD